MKDLMEEKSDKKVEKLKEYSKKIPQKTNKASKTQLTN